MRELSEESMKEIPNDFLEGILEESLGIFRPIPVETIEEISIELLIARKFLKDCCKHLSTKIYEEFLEDSLKAISQECVKKPCRFSSILHDLNKDSLQ